MQEKVGKEDAFNRRGKMQALAIHSNISFDQGSSLYYP
jgi:hypothetical protein